MGCERDSCGRFLLPRVQQFNDRTAIEYRSMDAPGPVDKPLNMLYCRLFVREDTLLFRWCGDLN